MTRKRFIKLLMSQGVQRNDAEKIAYGVLKTHRAYTCMTLAMCNYQINRARLMFEKLKLEFKRFNKYYKGEQSERN